MKRSHELADVVMVTDNCQITVMEVKCETPEVLREEEVTARLRNLTIHSLHIDEGGRDRKRDEPASADPVPAASLHSLPPAHVRFAAAVFSLFLDCQNRAAFVGDLEERSLMLRKLSSPLAANLWLWRQVIHSFISLAFDALKRVSGVEKVFRRIGS